ncbi:uncharacterized protein EKO05_0006595 [Ascochyta rabiei]|uniref:Uncharacterized protein n=1 Tax=Didymella rabiei TaxID=5454 RepID=A0A162W1C2_DIDRA|nr:uncharacterized protein EKO05_0006595 [Ascochyta rabiei]KZM18729.1 hypothetical protein ST47_g10046 [Ascochyta rabiei]UPX16179.1 hypothetical protein EKO05_0006595 [Ascochyta rabiei]
MNALLTTFLATMTSLLFVSTHASNVRTIHQFPNPTWLENIAAMHNGSVLVSILGKPEVHMVNPSITPSSDTLVASIPAVNAILGITELSDNVFAVAVGNVTPANVPVLGSFGVWSIDLKHKHEAAKVQKLADTPNLNMINGLAALDHRTLLLADSLAGNIASLDVRTGETAIWLGDESTASNASAPGLPFGVNGIKVHSGHVYYTNTVRNSLNRIRTSSNGTAIGDVEILAQGEAISVPDDFAVLNDGTVIQARPMGNELVKVGTDGNIQVLAKVAGVTAVAIGSAHRDTTTAYLSSMGGFSADGSVESGGMVLALKLE